ncbi:hypothetical protein [Geobacter sp. SVR]|uniref:hypothetical protein n=1 Tax=Geobacter sp. SVR TaxID=2495594 RepID=UPI001564D287|nr:hypothetical protein [Geobacter sp. SVR]
MTDLSETTAAPMLIVTLLCRKPMAAVPPMCATSGTNSPLLPLAAHASSICYAEITQIPGLTLLELMVASLSAPFYRCRAFAARTGFLRPVAFC